MVDRTVGVEYASDGVADEAESSAVEELNGMMPVRRRHKIASRSSVKPNERAKYCSREVSW